jgi:uncharacterized protein YyaL (SSP411 family)
MSLPSASDGGNRLAREKSPYLLQHARNPVDWHAWGEEAFAKAREENKPIFLSVGYSTCHWCHVMAHESFEDPQTAAIMNELFVNVKVDREERPDVDRIYMTFIQATSGSGGWPMSVWLQPDLKPIFGGTYFPPDDRYGRRGFASVCRSVAQVWNQERDKVLAQSERIIDALRDYTSQKSSAGNGVVAPEIDEVLREACRPLISNYDVDWGGFGDAPKFPRPVTLFLLARVQARLGDPSREGAQARQMLLATLDHMTAGGMHDHLGGGFHRYSVDRYWHIPHFEKMLYDQAQLAVANLEAFQISRRERYADTVRDILSYVLRDLTSPEGGFYCAEDADSLLAFGRPEHAEGAFYVWTKAEIEAALAHEEAALFIAHYGVQTEGNSPSGSDPHGEFTGKNTLIALDPLEESARSLSLSPERASQLLASAREKLLAARAKRPRPHLDDKILTAWNGLMISAFARAYQVLEDETYLAAARRSAAFLRANLYRESDKILLRSYREGPGAVEGFADDYAFLIQGLLDLYEAGFDIAHLQWAEQLQDRQDELFHDAANGGYFAASGRDDSVLLRLKEDHDGAEPSASSVSAFNLGRLAAMTGREELHARGLRAVAAFGVDREPGRAAQMMPLMVAALDFLSSEPRRIVVAGRADAPDTRALLRAARQHFQPDAVFLLADGAEGQRELARRLPYVETASPQDGRAAFYLCENQTCQLPVTDPAEVSARLTR